MFRRRLCMPDYVGWYTCSSTLYSCLTFTISLSFGGLKAVVLMIQQVASRRTTVHLRPGFLDQVLGAASRQPASGATNSARLST